MPTVSIVVPVYNVASYLEETVQSVLDQTWTDWELILVDDGSTDESGEIAKKLAESDSRIQYFHKENGGQASARNYGIKKSQGTYVALLDSDDLWLPEKLATQMEELKEHNPDFLYGLGYYYYPEREDKLEAYEWVSGKMSGKEFFDVLYHSCFVNTNTVLVKRELFDQVGYFDEDQLLRGTEDWDLWMRIAKQVNTVYGSPSRNVYYRIHESGIHLQKCRMLIGKIRIYEKYDGDKTVRKLIRKREYRYVYRELFDNLYKEGRSAEIIDFLNELMSKDPLGFGSIWQRTILPIFTRAQFIRFSNRVIYRIAYRLETFWYRIFLGSEYLKKFK